MRWAYGITTVPERRFDLLPHTLTSLAAGGFPKPHLFIDGCWAEAVCGEQGGLLKYRELGLPLSLREPPAVRTVGNWVLALLELFYRNPGCDRYALFQDDIVCSRNLCAYLTRSPYPEKSYLNLYTMPSNQSLVTGRDRGWFRARSLESGPPDFPFQTGRGAVALVFSKDALLALFSTNHLVEKATDENNGWRKIDGGVVTAMNKAGWSEYCHTPSLVQHVGFKSSMNNRPHPQSPSFRGEDFDLMELLA